MAARTIVQGFGAKLTNGGSGQVTQLELNEASGLTPSEKYLVLGLIEGYSSTATQRFCEIPYRIDTVDHQRSTPWVQGADSGYDAAQMFCEVVTFGATPSFRVDTDPSNSEADHSLYNTHLMAINIDDLVEGTEYHFASDLVTLNLVDAAREPRLHRLDGRSPDPGRRHSRPR